MPVIPKPEGFKPFGGRTVVMFGGINIEAMRKWQARVRAAENQSTEDATDKLVVGEPDTPAEVPERSAR